MVPLAVSGVQAWVLDEARSGILSGISAKPGLVAEAAMAAPAMSPAHFVPRIGDLRKHFGVNNEIICSLMAVPAVGVPGRPAMAVAGQPRTFQIINKAEV